MNIRPGYFIGTLLATYMIIEKNHRILAKYTMCTATLCSFWKNISGHFVRFSCNHSLCTGSTVVGQCMEQRSGVPNGYAFRRIVQTTAMDGGSVDFAGASHRPDSLTDFIKYAPIVCIPMKYPG